jgi:hypothetical protein
MLRVFGAQYLQYMRRTGAFLPFTAFDVGLSRQEARAIADSSQ